MFYYCIYQVTNLLNGKIYVGAHKTKNVNDHYMGSGKIILAAIKKYGRDNFSKTILEICDTPEQMYHREREIVNTEFIERLDTYNTKLGGIGGFDHVNSNKNATYYEQRRKGGKSTNGKNARLLRDGKKGIFNGDYSGFKSDEQQLNAITASKAPEAIAKRKDTYKRIGHCQGEKNPSFGTCWVFREPDGKKKIKKELLDQYLSEGWKRGMK